MNDTLKSIFRDPPVLFTKRLVLRKMDKKDSADMFLYAKDAEVTKYLLWSPHPDESCTGKYLASLPQKYKAGEFFDWAVTYNGRMIGNCGFSKIDLRHRCAEIGYVIARDMWGKGFASEAAQSVIEFGFDTLKLHRIEARFMEQNTASRRVAEKLGMTFEGFHRECIWVKGKFRSTGTCSILESEFDTMHHHRTATP